MAVLQPAGEDRRGSRAGPLTVLIASPLEPELVEKIARAEPDRVRVIFEPALLPEARYVADHKGRPPELSAAGRARWLAHLERADVLFDFDWLAEEALPQNAPRVRWVQATSAGIGERLRRSGLAATDILFTTAAGVHGSALAEFVILGLLYFQRDVPRLQRMQAARRWERFTNSELAGRRVLLVGLGGVGRPIAQRLAALDVEVWGVRRSAQGPLPEGVTRLLSLDEFRGALGDIDALILACPLTERTHRLIGEAELGALPRHALLINVARGQVVDEAAMTAALSAGRLRGAVLDVAEVEPLPRESPLWDLPNVLISPHSASTVERENERIVDLFIDNLRRWLDGRPLRNLFERERGY